MHPPEKYDCPKDPYQVFQRNDNKVLENSLRPARNSREKKNTYKSKRERKFITQN